MKKVFRSQSHYYVFALLLAVMVAVGGVFYDDIQNIGVRAADYDINCDSTAVTESSYGTSDNLTFKDSGDGICILDEPLSVNSVTIESGVTLTHTGEDSDGLDITTAGNFTINSGGAIDVSEKGCAYDGVSPYNGSGPDGSNICGTDTTYP
ncbi:hypothetical protein JW752_05330, partial [Candidatus Peregrinibacteria bacterium]|nr:hypothetical protein [Candidatus Peregrinibacteria bacterium]